MTLMTLIFLLKNYFEAIFFCISDCAKNALWDIRLVSAITESRKLKTLSRFCYNALPNLISQYTKYITNLKLSTYYNK
jgi:hypothetical protein